MLGIAVGTCKAQVHRARTLLSARLGRRRHAHDDPDGDGTDARLDARCSQMPREVEPPADLWPGIAARLDEATRCAANRRAGRSRWMLPQAAAAVVLVAGSSLLTATLLGTCAAPAQTARAQPPATAMSEGTIECDAGRVRAGRATRPEYIAARRQLAMTLQARLARMPPSARAETRGEPCGNAPRGRRDQRGAGQQPGDPLLEELLLKTYQDELAVLANVNQLTRKSRCRRRTEKAKRIEVMRFDAIVPCAAIRPSRALALASAGRAVRRARPAGDQQAHRADPRAGRDVEHGGHRESDGLERNEVASHRRTRRGRANGSSSPRATRSRASRSSCPTARSHADDTDLESACRRRQRFRSTRSAPTSGAGCARGAAPADGERRRATGERRGRRVPHRERRRHVDGSGKKGLVTITTVSGDATAKRVAGEVNAQYRERQRDASGVGETTRSRLRSTSGDLT